jgi:predicted HicB family RNase H-like nuclease
MAAKKRPCGRPPINPRDLKSATIAWRIHPDLNSELNKIARLEGISKSTLINHRLIRLINERSNRTLVDNIGRHSARVVS